LEYPLATPIRPPLPFANISKVELHRHLEGSLRLDTLVELVRTIKLDLPETAEALARLVQFHPTDPRTAENFLSKFQVLRNFYASPAIIQRLTQEVIQDAALENICYLELHFTPVALSKAGGFPLDEVVDWVIEAARAASHSAGIQVGLVASFNRHESVEEAEQVAGIAVDRQGDGGIVGIGLAGDERQGDTHAFSAIFKSARSAGLGLCVHAGEWGGSAKVSEAIERFGAGRIGHGVRVVENAEVVDMARENRTVFEICLTSNFQSGVVQSVETHPLPEMIQAGLQVTLNTDDPGISGIQLSDEYERAVELLGISRETVHSLILAAAQASFLEPAKQRELEQSLELEFFGFKA
jgi:adenosine deaminase